MGIEHKVLFAGEIPNAALYLKALDIFVFTSLDEGLPNVILEAGAAGLPIITWDLPFYREIIPKQQDGFLVPSGDIETFAFTLSKLLINPQIRSDVGSNARASILNSFGLGRYIENMTSVYESIVQTKHLTKPPRI